MCCLALSVCAAGASIARADIRPLLPADAAPASAAQTTRPAPPTDADVEQFMDWFAVQEILPVLLRKIVDEADDTAAFTASQRACVLKVTSPVFADGMREQFRGMLVDHETFLAWSDLMKTTVGPRFVAFLQGSMKADFLGGPAPSQDGLLADLTDDDRAAMARFASSKALQGMQAAPEFDLDAETEQRLKKEARTRCGVSI